MMGLESDSLHAQINLCVPFWRDISFHNVTTPDWRR